MLGALTNARGLRPWSLVSMAGGCSVAAPVDLALPGVITEPPLSCDQGPSLRLQGNVLGDTDALEGLCSYGNCDYKHLPKSELCTYVMDSLWTFSALDSARPRAECPYEQNAVAKRAQNTS